MRRIIKIAPNNSGRPPTRDEEYANSAKITDDMTCRFCGRSPGGRCPPNINLLKWNHSRHICKGCGGSEWVLVTPDPTPYDEALIEDRERAKQKKEALEAEQKRRAEADAKSFDGFETGVNTFIGGCWLIPIGMVVALVWGGCVAYRQDKAHMRAIRIQNGYTTQEDRETPEYAQHVERVRLATEQRIRQEQAAKTPRIAE